MNSTRGSRGAWTLRYVPLFVPAMALAGCELAEVTTASADDVLVVEAVLRTDMDPQYVLLHRTVQGRTADPVEGATVTVTGDDGRVHVFVQGGDCYSIHERYFGDQVLDFRGTCYTTALLDDQWVIPGRSYELRVETHQGEVGRGRTTVPGEFTLVNLPGVSRVGVGSVTACRLPPDTPLPVTWTAAEGAWSYTARLSISGLRGALAPRGIPAPEPLELRGFALSRTDTTLLLPTEFGVFERLQYNQDLLLAIRDGLPGSTQAELVVAAADRNWLNGARGAGFNPSGQVRISSVIGDGVVGVFGSLVPLRTVVVVTPQPTSIIPCLGAH